jgi:hypothetical protein
MMGRVSNLPLRARTERRIAGADGGYHAGTTKVKGVEPRVLRRVLPERMRLPEAKAVNLVAGITAL